MNRPKFQLMLAFALAQTLAVGMIHSEPSKHVNWLMYEPLSLWDYGLIRLQQILDKKEDDFEAFAKVFYPETSVVNMVNYDWDKNRIFLKCFTWTGSSDFSEDIVKTMMRKQVQAIYRSLFLRDDGTPVLGGTSNLASLFTHEGYQKETRPKELGKTLDSITEIHLSVSGKTHVMDAEISLLSPISQLRFTDIRPVNKNSSAK